MARLLMTFMAKYEPSFRPDFFLTRSTDPDAPRPTTRTGSNAFQSTRSSVDEERLRGGGGGGSVMEPSNLGVDDAGRGVGVAAAAAVGVVPAAARSLVCWIATLSDRIHSSRIFADGARSAKPFSRSSPDSSAVFMISNS